VVPTSNGIFLGDEMPYLNLDLNYFDHPKTRRLIGILGPLSDILPLRLWAYCAKIHPSDGVLKGYSDQEIHGVIGADNDAHTSPMGSFTVTDALVRVGFLKRIKNGAACVDWLQHQGHLEAFSRRGKENARKRWDRVASSNATSIASSNAKNKSGNAPTYLPTKPTNPTSFDAFWAAYPNKVNKKGSAKIWAKINPDDALLARILAAVEAQKSSAGWVKDGGRYIPYPTTWLNGEKWEDIGVVAPVLADPPENARLKSLRAYEDATFGPASEVF
jgi:hypothetical protein